MKTSSRSIHLTTLALLASTGLSFAATTILTDDFEGSLGNWTGSDDASLYTYSSGTDYAIGGDGAARLNTGGFDGSNPLTLTDALTLTSWSASDVTITFDVVWDATTGTRFFSVQYSNDNGSSWSNIGGTITASTTAATGISRTVSSGLTDEFLFRFNPKDDGNDTYAYIDNISITSSDAVIPEPSAALLGALGSLLLLRRRRVD